MISQSVGLPDINQAFGRPDQQVLFPRFCNAVMLAETARPLPTRPNFSDSPGQDGGFDGSWNLPADDPLSANAKPFARPGWNAFQFKARAPATPISALISSVRGAVAQLILRSGRPRELKQYSLFTNLNFRHETTSVAQGKKKLKSHSDEVKAALREGLPEHENVLVEVFDGAFLQTAANCHPALREAFFGEKIFQTWDESQRISARLALFENLPLTGRDKELTQLRTHLADPSVRFIGVSGGSGMGKTRLVIEATQPLASETLFVRSTAKGRFLNRDIATYGTAPRLVLVVEDLRENEANHLAEQLLLHDRLCVVATIPAEEHLPALRLSESPGIQHLPVPRLGDDPAKKLIEATGAKLSRRVIEWLVQEAGGNPQVILAAAALGPELQTRRGELKADVAKSFLRRARDQFGSDGQAVLEALSPLSPFNCSSEEHLTVINRVLDLNVSLAEIRRQRERMIHAGFVEGHGRTSMQLTVSPPLLAAYLFEQLLQGRPELCWELYRSLDTDGQHRLLDRLISVEGVDQLSLWPNLFGVSGPFVDGSSLETHIELLAILARVAPRQTAAFLLQRIEDVRSLARRTFLQPDKLAHYMSGEGKILRA